MRILKPEWLPACQAERIITHWTAGGHQATDHDREFYHFLFEADGKVVRGYYTPADNDYTGDGAYAAHTYQCNTRSIGLSACAMAGASEGHPGRYPMTDPQWSAMVLATADLCERYRIPVRPDRVLGHGEVTRVLGIDQGGKWDPLFLPWRPELRPHQVGDLFRAQVAAALGQAVGTPATPRPPDPGASSPATAVLRGHRLRALLTNEGAYLELRAAVGLLAGWRILEAADTQAVLRDPAGRMHHVELLNLGGTGHSPVRQLAAAAGLRVTWDHTSKTATLS